MNQKEFDTLLEDSILILRQMLSSKGKEYARGDRLSNFKSTGCFNNQTPEQALWGFVSKHLISLRDHINDLKFDPAPDLGKIDERIFDIIAYMQCLRSLYYERRNVYGEKLHPQAGKQKRHISEETPKNKGAYRKRP